MKVILSMVTIAMLSGCASKPTSPAEVKIPIPVSCKVDTPKSPPSAVDALPLGSSIWQQMAALRADRISRQAYERELEAAISACQ